MSVAISPAYGSISPAVGTGPGAVTARPRPLLWAVPDDFEEALAALAERAREDAASSAEGDRLAAELDEVVGTLAGLVRLENEILSL